MPIGVTCRLCERMDCEQRAFPSSRHPLRINENVRGLSFYAPVGPRHPPPLRAPSNPGQNSEQLKTMR